MSIYEVAGETIVAADALTGKAEEEARRAAKGKAWVVEEDEEAGRACSSGGDDADSVVSAGTTYSWQAHTQQHGQAQPPAAAAAAPSGSEKLRKIAAAVLWGMPTVEEAIEYAMPEAPAQGSQPPAVAGTSGPFASQRLDASWALPADVELAVFGGGGGGGSYSPSGSGSRSGASSRSISMSGSDFNVPIGSSGGSSPVAAGPSSSGSGWMAAGPSGSGAGTSAGQYHPGMGWQDVRLH